MKAYSRLLNYLVKARKAIYSSLSDQGVVDWEKGSVLPYAKPVYYLCNILTLYNSTLIRLGVAFPLFTDSSDDATIFLISEVLPLELKKFYLQKEEKPCIYSHQFSSVTQRNCSPEVFETIAVQEATVLVNVL